MRWNRLLVAVTLAAIAGIAALVSSNSNAAVAVNPAPASLPLQSEYQVVADTAHGHLFFSQGTLGFADPASDDAIIVTDLSGHLVATIPGQAGVEGMALSPGGTTLYAALSLGNAVSAISTTTLKQTSSYSVPAADDPEAVAVQSGRLWVSYHAASGTGASIGSIDPANTASFTPDALPVPIGVSYYSTPQIAADPENNGTLVVSSEDTTPATLTSYNVSNPAAVAMIATAATDCPHMAVLPGGASFLCGSLQVSAATLLGIADYGGDAPTVAPDGAVAVGDTETGARTDGTPSEDLFAYAAGTAEPTAVYSLGGTDAVLADLAWSADSQRLFAIVRTTKTGNKATYALQTLSPFTDPFQLLATSFKLTSSTGATSYAGMVTVTTTEGLTDTIGGSLSLYEQPAGGKRVLVNSGGAALDSIGVILKPSRTTTFTAVFDGKVWWSSKADVVTKTVTIGVGVKLTAALSGYYKSTTISGTGYRVYHHTATLKDTVSVTPAHPGECVRLQVQAYAKGAWHPYATTRCGTLNKASRATIPLKLGVLDRFRVRSQFVRSAKDTANLSTAGGWLYYDVVK